MNFRVFELFAFVCYLCWLGTVKSCFFLLVDCCYMETLACSPLMVLVSVSYLLAYFRSTMCARPTGAKVGITTFEKDLQSNFWPGLRWILCSLLQKINLVELIRLNSKSVVRESERIFVTVLSEREAAF